MAMPYETSKAVALKAEQVFDEMDRQANGLVPATATNMHQLLHGLGETMEDEACSEVITLIDQDGSGFLQRDRFVSWYGTFVVTEDDKADDIEKARHHFIKFSNNSDCIDKATFQKVLNDMGLTYSQALVDRLSASDDTISMNAFVDWYITDEDDEDVAMEDVAVDEDVAMGDDAAVDENVDPLAATAIAGPGWGSMFLLPPGSWTCTECLVSNKPEVNTCVACETKHDGISAAVAPTTVLAVAPTTVLAVAPTAAHVVAPAVVPQSKKPKRKTMPVKVRSGAKHGPGETRVARFHGKYTK